MTLRPYQRLIAEHISRNRRCAVWAGMGLGKSLSTLTGLETINLSEAVYPALVVAPYRVAASTWPDEVRKWEHLRHLRVSTILGGRAQRERALAKDADIYTINYENLPWLVEHLGDRWPFSTVVCDESTRLKSFRTRQGGKRAQALAKVSRHVDRLIQLTGTPAPQGLVDLWGQVWFLDQGYRLGMNFTAFTNRWFRQVRVGQNINAFRLEPVEWAQREIEDKVSDLVISINAADHFPVDDPIHNIIHLDLPAPAMALYKEMERDLFILLHSGEVEASNAAVKTGKCLQLASGAIYTDDSGKVWEEVHKAKIEALQGVIEEAAGNPVLVAYHWRHDLERLLKAIPGAVALDKSPETIRKWNQGEIPVLLAHPASAGHGLNLADGGNILVMFSHDWSLENYLQIIERIGPVRQAQAGHPRPVFIHHLVATGTLDETVLARRESKQDVMAALMERMKCGESMNL